MSTITLPIPPSVNALTFNKKKGGRAKTNAYSLWCGVAGWELKRQRPPKIKGPVIIECRFEEAATRCDLDNLTKAVLDLLVTHQVIEDDKREIVRKISLEWALGVRGVAVTVINLRPQASAELQYLGGAE